MPPPEKKTKLADVTHEKFESCGNQTKEKVTREIPELEREHLLESRHNVKIRFGRIDLFKVETQSVVIPDYDVASLNPEHTVFSQFITKLDEEMRTVFSEERKTDKYISDMRTNFVPFFSKTTMLSVRSTVPIFVSPPTMAKNKRFTPVTEAELRAHYFSILHACDSEKLKSVAMPILGHNIKRGTSLVIAMQTLYWYFQVVEKTNLELVYVVTNDKKEYDLLGENVFYFRELDLSVWSRDLFKTLENDMFRKLGKHIKAYATMPGTDMALRVAKSYYSFTESKQERLQIERIHAVLCQYTGVHCPHIVHCDDRKSRKLPTQYITLSEAKFKFDAIQSRQAFKCNPSIERQCGSNAIKRKLWFISYYVMYFSDITSSHVRGQKISAIGLRKYLFHKLKELHDTISEEWERITREAPYTCTCQRSDGKHEAYAEFNTEMSHFDVMYHQWVALDGTAAETLENYLQGWTDDYKHTVEDFHTKRNSFLSNQSHNNRAMFENVDLESLLIGTEPAVDERRQSISQLVSSVQQEIRAAHLARWLSENKQILKSDKACDIVWMSGNKEPTNPNLCKKQCEKGTRGELSTTVAEKIESRTRFQPNVKKDLIKRRRVKKFGFTLFRSKYNLRGKTADKLDTEEGREKENEEEEELNGTSIGKEAEQEHIHLDHRFQKDAHGNLAHISLASRYGPRLSNTDRILQYNEYSRLFEVDAHDVEILAKSQAEISVAAVFRLLYSRVGRHNTGRSPQESVALVHPLFVSKLFEQTNLDSVKFNQIFHEHVSFFEEGVESFLMPIYQESRSHFVLAHIWIDNAGRPTLRVMDSVFSKTPMITDIEAELVMVNLFPGGRRANIIDASPSDIPRQDINGCGIETVLNAELALQHRGRDWPKIVPRTRTKVETNIYRHHFSAELENIRREDKLYVEQKATIPTLMGNNSTRHSDQRNELIETSFTSEPVYESEPILENGMSNMEVNNNTRTSQSVEQEEWNIIRNKLNSHKKKVSRAARAKTSRFSAHSKIKHTAVISTHKKTKKSINNSGKVIRLNTGVFGNTLTNLPTTTENEEDEGEIDVQSTTAEATLNIPVQSNVEEILMFDNDNSRYESSDNCPHKRQLKDLLDEGKVVRHKTGKFVSATPRNSATLKVITETSNSSGNATIENILEHIEDTLRIVNKRSDRKVLNRCKDLLMKHINQRREDRMDDTETSNDSMIDSEEPMSAEYDPTTPKQPHLKFLSTAQEELLVKQYPTTPISVLSRRFNLSEDPKTARVEARRIMNRREKGLPNHREAVAKLKESVSESVTFRDEIEQQDIHERDITRLGLERARFFGVKAFRGSRHWVQKVKNQCHMKSRHIDARISQRTIDQSARIADDVTMFKCVTVPQLIMKYSASKMWNVDQTGVELEMTRRRTLTRIGTKKVLRRAQRNNSLTHSFTLNICISASGEVLPKCFVTLHEPKPPQSFQTLVAPYTELYVTNSRSGKMDSRLAIEWLEELFLPNVADRSLLLLDSWPGFNQMLDMPIVRRRKLRTVVFPPGTTGELQPLDLQFNRQFKNFLQQIHMEIRRVDPTFIISIRANLLQILSFVYNQIKAPIFKNWIKAGFVQLGVIRTRNSYVVPAQYCLDPTKTGGKSCSKCTKFSSIQCAHCDILFCIICVLKHIH